MCMACIYSQKAVGQSLSGKVVDENNMPVPFANIFIREMGEGTAADQSGNYFFTLLPGLYTLAVSSVGYKTASVQVVVMDKPVVRNLLLQSSSWELDEVVIRAKRRDPAYEIVQHAIDNKEKYLTDIQSFKAEVYMRASEKIDVMEKKAKAKEPEMDHLDINSPMTDPIAKSKNEENELDRMSLLELQATLYFRFPDDFKEVRTAYKAYGGKDGLFVPVFNEVNFNFYHNMVRLKGISDVTLISPLSRTALLTYKYALEETLNEGGQVVYKIKVTPRKTGDATCSGYLFINEGLWNINRLELTIHKGGLKLYDRFTIIQHHTQLADSTWIPSRQQFDYVTKFGGKTFNGTTLITYTSFENGAVFPPKFFGNEVSSISKEAYERDSTFWNGARQVPLTPEQQRLVFYRDSIQAAHSSKEYLDSIQAAYNKVTFAEVMYQGMGFRNNEKKSNLYFSPLLGLIGFEVVGGFRLGPYISYFRMLENGKRIHTSGSFDMGLKNNDWQGGLNYWMRYDPYRLGDFSIRVGRSFKPINSFDAYLNQLRFSNFILHEFGSIFHRREYFNGFYFGTEMSFHNRSSITGLDKTSILNSVIKEDEPLDFEDYRALITDFKVAYTPGQRYMREPNQKVVLGSDWPTLTLLYRKGWNGALNSAIDFDFLEFMINQQFTIGTLGSSRYTVQMGKFLNERDLPIVDIKRFRQSDPYLLSDPMHSFQLLDTALNTSKLFFEMHYLHHFNGAMVNNIPLVKKLQLRTVAGAGFMWIREGNYRYEEIFGGIERIFKISARRRLKIGTYAVLAQSNYHRPRTDFKVSFDIIDTWKRDWSY